MIEDRSLTSGDDAVVMIHQRNEFYRNKLHWMLGVFLLGLIAIIGLTGMLVYMTRNPIHPLYFITDNAGRLIQDIPLGQPNMSTQDVALWAEDAVVAANSYDYANYHAQLQRAQKYFTDYGWRSYMKGLQASNNLEALTKRKLIFLAKVAGQPKLLAEGRVGKSQIYAWKLQIPVVITYLLPPYDGLPGKSKFENAYLFTVLVMRQSVLTSFKGLGIMQIIGASAENAGSQDLLAAPPA
jgi:intracellular multiplication protein IcmL